MPPKSQNIFSLGLANKTSGDQVTKTRLLFEVGFPSISFEDDALSNQSEASTANRTRTSTLLIPGNHNMDEPVLRSVKVQPEIPEMTKPAGTTLQIRQLWEGTVTEVGEQAFTAVLNDKTQQDNPAELVEFDSFELRQDDLELLAPGSVFYWMIGTERTPSGQVRNISTIEISRLPMWTRGSLRAASEKVSNTSQWFHANGNCAS